jgi:diguanylate cyclase (GGDEF)-like protein
MTTEFVPGARGGHVDGCPIHGEARSSFAVARHVRIPVAQGYGSATQLAFVPMLFFAPLNLVPLMVLAGFLASDVPSHLRGRVSGGYSVLRLGDSWFAFGPVLVLAAAGGGDPALGNWPIYVVALAAQLAIDPLLHACADAPLEGQRRPLREIVVVVGAVDVMLSLPAFSVVAMAEQAPVGAALTLAALLVIAGGFTRERRRRLVEHANATHDALTGLPNRLLFGELARAASARARRDGEPCAVLLLDLDSFKAVNDELGHEAGDRVLVQAAARLRDGLRATDSVARLGGDEFAVLLAGHQTVEACEHVADKLKRDFQAPFDPPAGPRCVGISIGAALIDGDRGFDEALHEADSAMYANKRAQSTRFVRDQLAPQRC